MNNPGMLAGSSRTFPLRASLGWLLVASFTFVAAFVLPFFFPTHHLVFSRAYTAGADNRIAVVAIAAISALVSCACWWFRIGTARSTPKNPGNPTRQTLAWGILAMLVFTYLLGAFVIRNGFFYSDAGYFLTQLRTGLTFHRALFRDFEFPYGFLLFEWPATFLRVFAWFHLSAVSAYITSLAAAEVVGTAMLFYTVCALPMRRSLKLAAFAFIVFGALDPLLGLNYSLLRFVLPLASAVLLARQPTILRASIVAALGETLCLSTSPELGIAFGGAALLYGLFRARISGLPWSAVSGATLLGGGLFALLTPPYTFATMSKFAGGAFNLILQPVPHVLCLLVAVVALAPLAVAWGVRHGGFPSHVLFVLYVASLGMLPSALQRGDPLHAFFSGLGAYLLAFVAIDKAGPIWRRRGILFIAFAFLYTQAQDFFFYRQLLAETVRGVSSLDIVDVPTVQRLQATLGPNRVLFPWTLPLRLSNTLTASHQFEPDFFCVMPLDSASEQVKVDEMRRVRYVMVPTGWKLAVTDDIDNGGFKRWLRLGYTYKVRQTPYVAGAQMEQELRSNWQPDSAYGPYTLYRRVH